MAMTAPAGDFSVLGSQLIPLTHELTQSDQRKVHFNPLTDEKMKPREVKQPSKTTQRVDSRCWTNWVTELVNRERSWLGAVVRIGLSRRWTWAIYEGQM